ncbi:Flp pilus assembly protein CpaB [Marinobacter sp. SS21]|uniref:Flp pilus assembly protein CpaB n=1 Tax=Marinobacter sp. SS21 TaxID=2979460 RepID=UPI00232DF3DC|nr:Flp pilus assembly protein CpaB [Marinobacter sp. SS21]MDC0663752.1 Flp pilus assembly protein CpaB [Marinobacter sp. SS21]
MKKKGIVAMLGVSLLLAIGAAGMANSWVQERIGTTDSEELTSAVVVAAVEIPFGRTVETTDLRMMELPPHAVPKGSFNSIDQVVGRISSQAIYADEVILERRVAEHMAGSALAAVLEPGMRAITVRVDDVAGVAGFLLPGNQVDVVSSKRSGSSRDFESTTILRGITVLAVDQHATQERDRPMIVRAVTLAVTPPQAERLLEATEEGKVQLTLRNPLEEVEEPVEVASEPEPVAAPAPAPAPRRVYRPQHVRVSVIRGTDLSSTTVNK